MKKALFLMVVLCMAIGIFSTANATLAWYEDFNYTVGDLSTNSLGNWTTHSGSGVGITVLGTPSDAGNSLATYGLTSSINNRVQIVSSQAPDENRVFPTPYTTRPGTVYASLLVKFTTAPAAIATYWAHFIDGPQSGSSFDGKLFAVSTTGGNIGLSVSWNQNVPIYSGPTIGLNQTAFIVERIDMVANSAIDVDTVSLWVNPSASTFGLTEPVADVSTTAVLAANVSANGLTRFALRESSSGGSYGTIEIDEIRVGTTWADVTPTVNAFVPVELSNFSVK